MKLFLAGAAALIAVCNTTNMPCSLLTETASERAMAGDYIEGRTASVFAGACHFGGEYTLTGREAVLAWSIRQGVRAGVDLAGTCVVAVVADDSNLAEETGSRRSVVYLSKDASPKQREALLDWLDPDVVGEVVKLVLTDVDCERDGDRFRVCAGEAISLVGSALPNRECCKMPFNVWYEPLFPVAEAVVGCAERFVCAQDDLDLKFVSSDENCAFVGAFGDAR